jgi:hypothetical protein
VLHFFDFIQKYGRFYQGSIKHFPRVVDTPAANLSDKYVTKIKFKKYTLVI